MQLANMHATQCGALSAMSVLPVPCHAPSLCVCVCVRVQYQLAELQRFEHVFAVALVVVQPPPSPNLAPRHSLTRVLTYLLSATSVPDAV